jgi:parallel beta-helix repeat protein
MTAPLRVRAARLVLVALLLAAGLAARPGVAMAATGADEVHYTFTSATSVAIDWRGDPADVRWGPTSSYGQTATGTAPAWKPWSSAGPFWQLELGGLDPGATYHYSIGGGPDYTFHTPPTGDFRFDAIGDVGDTVNFSKLGDTLDRIAADNPSFVLMAGDLSYANAPNSGQAAVDQHFNDVMRWSTSAAYMPAWGNHEYDVAGADDLRNYKGRLLMPHAQASPGSPDLSCCGNDWGWFDAGPVRFISYPEPWSGALADWQSHASVLMRQAQNDSSVKYVVTYGHRPPYSTGYHPGETQIAGILDGFGDSYSKYVLNIDGHSHDYERFQPIHGVTHVTVGAPSSLEVPWTSTDPRTAFRAMHLSHLRVDVSSTGLRLQSICDDSASKEDTTCNAGSVLDEYTIGTPPASQATTDVYVDKTSSACSDTGPGTQTTPLCSIAKGVSRLVPDATLYVGDGTYAETIKPAVNGTAADPITITAWPGRHPVVGQGMVNGAYIASRSYITLSNLTFSGTSGDAVYVSKSSHVEVSGNEVTSAGLPVSGMTARGLYLKSTTDSTVTANTVSGTTDAGIYVTTGSSNVTVSYNHSSHNAASFTRSGLGIWVNSAGNKVLGNVTHDNEDSGIQLSSGGNDNLVTDNVSYNNGDHGIDNLNVTGGRIVGNTVYRNCTSGINVEGTSGSYLVKNNVAVDNAVYPAYAGISCSRRSGNIGIWDSAPPTTTVDHNLVSLSKAGTMYVFKNAYPSLAAMRTATGQETHGVEADPKFAAPGSWNLELTAGSPAIDRADSGAPGQQDLDLLRASRKDDDATPNTFAEGPRAFDDLGAYEYQPDTAPPPPDPVAPTAAVSVSPASGVAPQQVTADASASKDGQGQALTYTYDFGDGSAVVGPQSGATATHTFTSAGSYVVKVTVTNTSGLKDTAQQTVTVTAPPPPAAPPSYVNQIATNYSTTTKSSGYVTVWRPAGVQAGHLTVLTLQLSGTAATGAVSATDDAGNAYRQVSSVADGSGNRLVVLAGTTATELPVNARITATFPSATTYRLTADELAGVSQVDRTASAVGPAGTFSSGPTGTTSAAKELVFGAVSVLSGSANPAWSAPWKDMGSYALAPRYLGRAYQVSSSPASYAAGGTAGGAWLASTVTFAP